MSIGSNIDTPSIDDPNSLKTNPLPAMSRKRRVAKGEVNISFLKTTHAGACIPIKQTDLWKGFELSHGGGLAGQLPGRQAECVMQPSGASSARARRTLKRASSCPACQAHEDTANGAQLRGGVQLGNRTTEACRLFSGGSYLQQVQPPDTLTALHTALAPQHHSKVILNELQLPSGWSAFRV